MSAESKTTFDTTFDVADRDFEVAHAMMTGEQARIVAGIEVQPDAVKTKPKYENASQRNARLGKLLLEARAAGGINEYASLSEANRQAMADAGWLEQRN